MILALLVALQASTPLEAAQEAARDGRQADAVALLEPLMRDAPTYDGLVALGLAQARLGRTVEARASFERALQLDGRRPEALVERAGLDFLEQRYDAAADGLARALARGDDPYARELRASALQLAGREAAALDEWNRLGEPRLGTVTITGLVKTRDRVARREIPLREGELLRADAFRETRLRLREVGVFPRVRLRTIPREDGRADVAVALVERHGFGTWRELVAITGANALRSQVRLRYWDVGSAGVVVGAEYKWEDTQPHVMAGIAWPRPFGLPAKLLVLGLRARPTYDLPEGGLRMTTRGADIGLRRVVGARTVAQVGWRLRNRTFTQPRKDAPPGRISALTAALERTIADGSRWHADARIEAAGAPSALGSDVRYGEGTATFRYELKLGPPDERALARSSLAGQVRWGLGSDGMPLDAMFAPGAGSEAPHPVRGHRQKYDGVLGQTPIGRSLGLLNVEWRQRLIARDAAQLGLVCFADVARVSRTAQGPDATLRDVGSGLRLGLAGGHVLRMDYGWSVSGDGRSTLTFGYGQAF